MPRLTEVFGPAYLDRVLRTEGPLRPDPAADPLDRSMDGVLTPGTGLTLTDPDGSAIEVDVPADWPGPRGAIALSGRLSPGTGPARVQTRGLAWHDNLGGMGAGFALALGGDLVSALGPEGDPVSTEVARRLAAQGIAHRPVRVVGTVADWTLLLTSGPFGDKLPVGFRGCHARLGSLAGLAGPADLRVVAGLPNRVAGEVLRVPGVGVRLFAPNLKNMTDRDISVGSFADAVDLLCCNRVEWEALEDREQVAWQVSVLAITDGPAGSIVRFTTPDGSPGLVREPAFPRSSPPRDTNRAGEAYAATLVTTLLSAGWTPGVAAEALVRHAARRASAAAALVLDRADFGFPDAAAIDSACEAGVVAEGARAVSGGGGAVTMSVAPGSFTDREGGLS